MPTLNLEQAVTGIVVLNYHEPEQTALCVARLLEREPATSRILWIENDSARTRDTLMACLASVAFPWVELDPERGPLPPAGTVGVILCPENLGYAGGNNVGLRLLHRHGVPFGWVLNNDTLLVAGSSAELAAASTARPEVGAWGTVILTDQQPQYFGGIIKTRDFAITLAKTPESLEDPLAFVSGCSLFMPLAIAAGLGFLPADYFLYYEDPSFSLQLKRAGYGISGLWTVSVRHLESLATGRRSPLMEFYSLRNRWFFIERFFPGHLAAQKRRIAYTIQKYLLRGRFRALCIQWAAYRDYRSGKLGKTERSFGTVPRKA
jgi:GT2 family glycosyltransferase